MQTENKRVTNNESRSLQVDLIFLILKSIKGQSRGWYKYNMPTNESVRSGRGTERCMSLLEVRGGDVFCRIIKSVGQSCPILSLLFSSLCLCSCTHRLHLAQYIRLGNLILHRFRLIPSQSRSKQRRRPNDPQHLTRRNAQRNFTRL